MRLHTFFALLALAGVMCLGPLSGQAQFHQIMTITGKSDGALKARGGSSGDLTSVVDVSAIMVLKRKDIASGSHGPVTITKTVDPASPNIMQAHTTGEVLPKISFKLYKPGDNTKWKVVTFDNAIITGLTVKKGVKNPNGDPGKGKANQQPAPASTSTSSDTGDHEEVSFTYQTLEIVYYSGGSTSTTDDWNSPN